MTWQPIESAPKNGTAVWLWCNDTRCLGYFQVAEAPWDDQPGKWFIKAAFRRRHEHKNALMKHDDIFGTYSHDAKPTYWMPLPDLPEAS